MPSHLLDKPGQCQGSLVHLGAVVANLHVLELLLRELVDRLVEVCVLQRQQCVRKSHHFRCCH